MLIAGAGGFAREVLQLLLQQDKNATVFFFDDVNPGLIRIYDHYVVLKSDQAVQQLFLNDPHFNIGIGGPHKREVFFKRMLSLGGKPISIISPFAQIGSQAVKIGEGSIIATGTVITTDVVIGTGCLINMNCTIAHDTQIGDFCELSPGIHLSGRCRIGNRCQVGTGAVLLPGVTLGEAVVVGAGVVVTHDVEAHSTVIGYAARPIPKSSSGNP